MQRVRGPLLTLLLLAGLPGCQVYEDYMPWTWHFARDPQTGGLVVRREANSRWCRQPTPLKAPAAGERAPRPSRGFRLEPSPATSLATSGSRRGGEVVHAPKAVFRVCGEIDGRKVYRRLLPSEQVARELGAETPQ